MSLLKSDKTKWKMKFYWELTDSIFVGRNLICNDKSIMFLPEVDVGPFELYLLDWKIAITTGSIGITNFRYLSGYFFRNEIIDYKFIVPKSKKGTIKFDTNLEVIHGIYYKDCYHFVQKIYFDKDTHWLAIGDINATGEAIEFASNNIAVINETNDLVAVYVKLFFE